MLQLEWCPHCEVSNPSLDYNKGFETKNAANREIFWRLYVCISCGGVILVKLAPGQVVDSIWPSIQTVPDTLPDRAKQVLKQAIASRRAPSGAILLAASAVDAMLKARGLREGTLAIRISKATEERLITRDMAQWAHEIRLDANEQRHASEAAPMPDEASAQKCVAFARALADFLFVLPGLVQQGRAKSDPRRELFR